MNPVIVISRHHLDAMISHALEDAPIEACGVLAAKDGEVVSTHRAHNTEQSPYRFNIDPREYMRLEEEVTESGAAVTGFYHSHTGSEARPSPTDIRMMGPFFGPPFVHFVIGVADREKPHARVFTIEGAEANEHTFELKEA